VQLEDDLITLGYASTATLHDDGIFTSADAAAVARFQAALGVVQTGSLAAGEIVFEPGPVRVTALPVPLGAPLPQGGPVLQVTGTNHLVTIQLDASREGIVLGGDAVGHQERCTGFLTKSAQAPGRPRVVSEVLHHLP